MEFSKAKNYLEVATNIAVLIVSSVFLSLVAWNYFVQKQELRYQGGLYKGKSMPQMAGIAYRGAPKTLLIALDSQCSYCSDNIPFYKRLVAVRDASSKATRLTAIFPEARDAVEEYVQRNHLNFDILSKVNFGAFGISATPTLILIDSDGMVLDFWIGKVEQNVEQQIFDSIKVPQT